MIPTFIPRLWFTGLFSLGPSGGGIYPSREWYQRSWSYDGALHRSYFAPHFSWNEPTVFLVAPIILLVIALAGGLIVQIDDASRERRARATTQQRLRRPDGSEL
jgi:hypothetical protein